MVCNLQMERPRRGRRNDLCRTGRGRADLGCALSVGPALAGLRQPLLGTCRPSVSPGSALCRRRFLSQSSDLKVPELCLLSPVPPASEKFPHKSSARDGVGRRSWEKAAGSSCSVYPSVAARAWRGLCPPGCADRSRSGASQDPERQRSVNYIFLSASKLLFGRAWAFLK